ncbi:MULTISPECIES: arsenic transporter [Rhizobium]|uniref:Arsenic transporter n=1 Tax=Rhizobium tropici TaxID=398 RepID=A0A329Y527_RHITR|nr:MULTISPECIES: arsenic transporter [Rhizobium]MBB3285572.1 arsenical pump membrane protein [Rhizobium sp. BK252]MBB3400312.1 arsenical pump membrane protein [Rhizobium sp. BK289]MBB3412891.1 arsenical pump membrane protein [Rhizobium sp. BK284]MBB3480778.1 arsenical pump membrane protein [Rhizobium sp. BK347]MDK4719437.1 arsenic transporter [Rhizobium sp. CNPSo 3968]
MTESAITWSIAGLTALGVVARPFRWPEAIWAVLGAAVLLAFRLIGPADVWAGISKGFDVYLFLIGMMLLSELARREGLFDWVAAIATSHAKGSPRRLFVLVYGVGIVVTVFLSNDATAVVLTPAVYAACRAARVKDPMPYLLICAFIANAASFVLPISNPANLVIFAGGEMPPLSRWMQTFLLPSIVSIIATFACLYWTQRRALAEDTIARDVGQPSLSQTARLAGWGLVVTALVLIAASAMNFDLGMPTFAAGVITTVIILALTRQSPMETVRGISWSVLPLVAGLFVIVEAVNHTGLTTLLSERLASIAAQSQTQAIGAAGFSVAIVSNLVNNLPAGLFAGSAVQAAHVPDSIAGAVLIGVDLGPNLSVTGSLATILWLAALRREGLHIGALAFLRIGAIVMLPALILSLATLAVI